MYINFNIDENHIKKGKRTSIEKCPVALFLREQGFEGWIWAGYGILRINNRYYKTPKPISEFMIQFDNKKTSVEPISWEGELEEIKND